MNQVQNVSDFNHLEEVEGLFGEADLPVAQKKINQYSKPNESQGTVSKIIPLIVISLFVSALLFLGISYYHSALSAKLSQKQDIPLTDDKLKKLQSKIKREDSSTKTNNELSTSNNNFGNRNDNDDIKNHFPLEGVTQQLNALSHQVDSPSSQNEEDPQIKSDKEIYVDKNFIFSIPRLLWTYSSQPSNYLNELYTKNNEYYASTQRYRIIGVNDSNYHKYLSNSSSKAVDNLISILRMRLKSPEKGNLDHHMNDIVKFVILLNVLNENGGVMTTGGFAFTENFKWIKNIVSNPYVNRGSRGVKPQIVGFYSPYYSQKKSKENIQPFEGMEEVDRYTTVFPSMENYFMAAEGNTTFLTEVISKIYTFLENPKSFELQKSNYSLVNFKGTDLYYEYFLIAVQTILQDKQKEMDSVQVNEYRRFAIDYFGLYLINCYYGPYKIQRFWGDSQPHKAFYTMTQYSYEEFIDNVGPMRYMVKITPQSEMNQYLMATVKGERKLITEGSFIEKLLYNDDEDSKKTFIAPRLEKSLANSSIEEWTALPKIIWVFWDSGLINALVNNQLCVQNLKRKAKESGFEVRDVNLQNIYDYLDNETIQKIEKTIKNAKLKTYAQSRGDLYRLALLQKHGGVYMDASYIALQNFDWLRNIGQYPSDYIFNRFGTHPKVFMFWHPHFGSPHMWKLSKDHSTKSQWHLAYQNNFIAAQKDNQLIRDWFQLLLKLYETDYWEVQTIFKKCKIYPNKWINKNWHYLLAMDTIKCVIGNREQWLIQNNVTGWEGASDYYKIWSMSGYLGQQKFRRNLNLENPGSEDNFFIYRYSQEYVEGIIGKVHHLAKFYSQNNQELTKFVSKHKDGNFTGEAHSKSIFMRHIWRPEFVLQRWRDGVRLQPSS